MKTYVNTTLIDTHNAQMQLEQLEGVRLRRAGIFDVYGKFLMICAAGIATVMIGFGIMMWLMTPPVAPLGDEYITTYEISEVNIKGNASDISDSDIPGNGSPSISESLSEIQNNLEKVDKQTSESGVNPDVEGTDNFGGMKAGSIIRVWHNRADRELEFTVDGRHIQKVWKQANLGQLLVPAISIGPSTTCTLDITNFWSW